MTEKKEKCVSPRLSEARRVTWVGTVVNLVLAILKVVAGIVGKSTAMVADGVHSLSDLGSDVIVLIFVGIAEKKANDKYQYGHGKYETLATMIIAFLLALVAVGFLIDGTMKTIDCLRGEIIPRPGYVALTMAILSILSKEWLFRYTASAGKRLDSPILIANAWHHRSDALSSLATLLGISGAMFFGERWRLLDPVAAMIVSIFILSVAYKIGRPAIKELLEAALPHDVSSEMGHLIMSTPGVDAFHRFRSRKNGSTIILDFHIKVNPQITVIEAHDIASEVEQRLKQKYGDNMIVNIHIEPFDPKKKLG